MNRKAIAVYFDDSDKMDIEFSWLWKTWRLYSLDDEYDLVVYYNPTASERLKKYNGIVKFPMPYIRIAEKYKFLNSHYFCTDEWSEPLKKYDYILKTDCDVFLTQNLKTYTPSKIMVGEGGYYNQNDESKIKYIKSLGKKFGLHHNNMSLIGASFYGSTIDIIKITNCIAQITEYIIDSDYKTEDFVNSGFQIGVASMIAGEVYLNGAFYNQHLSLYTLDSKCWKTTKIGSDVLHIHAWHSDIPWSKQAYFRGEYSEWKVDFEEAFLNAANYCQWVANLSFEQVEKIREKFGLGNLKLDYGLFEEKPNYTSCIFANDGDVDIKVPNHKYSGDFCKRNAHEVLFRKINHWLITNKIIKRNIIDLGAWIGDNAIPWAKNIEGIIFAIDPSSENCEFIKMISEKNGIHNIKTIQKAISDSDRIISTKLEFGDNLHHCCFNEHEDGKTKIESTSIDALVRSNQIYDIGYIHLDVEGMEYTVIKGAKCTIQDNLPVITFEQHLKSDDYMSLCGFLIEMGYNIAMINESLPGCYPDCRNFLAIHNTDGDIFSKIRKVFDFDVLIDFKGERLDHFLLSS